MFDNKKIFVNLVYGGIGHESVLVIGIPRHSKRYIEMTRNNIERIRIETAEDMQNQIIPMINLQAIDEEI